MRSRVAAALLKDFFALIGRWLHTVFEFAAVLRNHFVLLMELAALLRLPLLEERSLLTLTLDQGFLFGHIVRFGLQGFSLILALEPRIFAAHPIPHIFEAASERGLPRPRLNDGALFNSLHRFGRLGALAISESPLLRVTFNETLSIAGF